VQQKKATTDAINKFIVVEIILPTESDINSFGMLKNLL
jgi:hypothetical protein